jgi:hypothetical protein
MLTNPSGSPPLAPVKNGMPIPSSSGSPTMSPSGGTPQPLSPLGSLVPLSTSAPIVGSMPSEQVISDKEREKALYPQRVILTSQYRIAPFYLLLPR